MADSRRAPLPAENGSTTAVDRRVPASLSAGDIAVHDLLSSARLAAARAGKTGRRAAPPSRPAVGILRYALFFCAGIIFFAALSLFVLDLETRAPHRTEAVAPGGVESVPQQRIPPHSSPSGAVSEVQVRPLAPDSR